MVSVLIREVSISWVSLQRGYFVYSKVLQSIATTCDTLEEALEAILHVDDDFRLSNGDNSKIKSKDIYDHKMMKVLSVDNLITRNLSLL